MCCFCRSGWRITWTRAVWTVYVKFHRRFFLYCLSFGSRSKHHKRCNIHLKCESITGQPASKLVVMTAHPGSSRTTVLVLRTKVFAKTILEHYSQTLFTKTVRILRTGLIVYSSLIDVVSKWCVAIPGCRRVCPQAGCLMAIFWTISLEIVPVGHRWETCPIFLFGPVL